jgi:hypothetical protein
MHLQWCVNPGQLMTVSSVSRSHFDRPCAITRTDQFRPATFYIAFPRQFCCFVLAITTFHASSRPLKHSLASILRRLLGPSRLSVRLQCP